MSSMQIPDAIIRRRSIRSFSSRQVSGRMVDLLIEAACCAPSAGNMQPWEFIVARDEEMKERLARAAGEQSFISEAPVVFVVCAVPGRSALRYGDRGRELYCLQDTAAAVQNLMVTASANGLGSCWVGAFDERRVSEILAIPDEVRPIALIPVGFPRESPPPRRKRPLEDVVHKEKW